MNIYRFGVVAVLAGVMGVAVAQDFTVKVGAIGGYTPANNVTPVTAVDLTLAGRSAHVSLSDTSAVPLTSLSSNAVSENPTVDASFSVNGQDFKGSFYFSPATYGRAGKNPLSKDDIITVVYPNTTAASFGALLECGYLKSRFGYLWSQRCQGVTLKNGSGGSSKSKYAMMYALVAAL